MDLEGRAEIWRIVRGTGPARAMGEWRRLERAVGGGNKGEGGIRRNSHRLTRACGIHAIEVQRAEARLWIDAVACHSQRVGNPYSGGEGEVHPWVTDKGVTMREFVVVHRSQEGSCVPAAVRL